MGSVYESGDNEMIMKQSMYTYVYRGTVKLNACLSTHRYTHNHTHTNATITTTVTMVFLVN